MEWHEGCLCELKDTTAAANSDLAMPAIFGATHFRRDGMVAEFCPCSIETIQRLNSNVIIPVLYPLLNRTFFRYFKVDLDADCPFWDDSQHSQCALRACGVDECSADEEARLSLCEERRNLSHVRRTAEVGGAWPREVEESSWTNEEEGEHRMVWVDLVDNPERYTGYSAEAGASKIWDEIHRYNSFECERLGRAGRGGTGLNDSPEHRVWCELTSGFHASVSSHIAANYLLDGQKQVWGLELDEYERRLGTHTERLRALHFSFLLVLHALELASAFLSTSFVFNTGQPREDAATARAVRELLSSTPEWPLTFEEQAAFAGVRQTGGCGCSALPSGACCDDEVSQRQQLLMTFSQRMHNISKLMDCVGCGRCRLWGKLQVVGLGTALRVLYAPNREKVLASLRRSHIVALFNLLGRLSHSVEVARLVVPLVKHVECAGCSASAYHPKPEDGDTSSGAGGLDPIAGLFGVPGA